MSVFPPSARRVARLSLAVLALHAAPVLAQVLPGDDFYTYANGAWLAATTIPPDRQGWGADYAVSEETDRRIAGLIEAASARDATGDVRRVVDYYRAFMDEAGIEARGSAPLRPLLAEIEAIRDRRQLAAALGASLRADVDPLNATSFETENLFGVWIAQGLTDPDNYVPYLLQGGLGLPDRAYYLDQTARMKKLRAMYRAHVAAMLRLAGYGDADARAGRVVELERQLARAHATREASADVQRANNPWRARDFAAKAPGMDWPAFFAAAGLARQERFIVYHPGAVKGAAALVARAPLQAWRDWLAFHTVNQKAGALPRAFVEQRFAFYGRTLIGTPQLSERKRRGLAAVNAALPEAVGKMYVETYFPPEAKARVQRMVGNIVAAFGRRIDNLDWMAPSTKREAKAKLDTLYVGVGYPDKWLGYDGLEIRPDDAFGNAGRAELFHYRRQLTKLGTPVDKTEWSMPPQLVNAVNMPMQNALNFPAAILQPPYFDPAAPEARNYGGIGATIGHEISHSFDDQGAQFDAKGRLRDWWTPADAAHFKAASARLVAQYDRYQAFPDLKLNGQLTLSENLADLAGLAAALDGFHASQGEGGATPGADREFFLGYAHSWRSKTREAALRNEIATDSHAPPQWRTYTVRNLDAWYRAFDVQPGQALYLPPGQRVRVW
ncbi:M13 family metallopeptidase [Pseudoduganella chitinolytica]|uniref:M13 family metallopeptidase n=1 Tax=Pseudoduganella chitinolytica TaxID=34070 RepID=A0ABY8BN58_9BURK|nr:M13 family metallopeptidase [Pseudoduganella chitinolytica]WEF35794.1 M13 family metallopeptidase [Pseudoduganella chitinolytica]